MLNPDISRRHFLKDMLGFAGLMMFPQEALRKTLSDSDSIDTGDESTQGLSIYIDESGVAGHEWYPFVLGLLIVEDPTKLTQRLEELREQHHFRTQLQYCSTDRFKVPYARDVIDHVLTNPGIRFAVRAAEEGAMLSDDAVSPAVIHRTHYRIHIASNLPNDPARLIVEKRSRTGEDHNLHNYLTERLKRVIQITVVEQEQNDLLQVADFLTGTVFSEMSGIKNKVKTGLRDYLRERLGVANLWDVSLSKRKDFKVVVVKKD